MQEGKEIFYHVFQRSFYDSNGDGHGDLQGLKMKLDYLVDLGITSIILLPLFDSPYYHNYFANDFRKIDPAYGDLNDFLDFVGEAHTKGLKVYLDMEIHYITEDHLWFRDSYGNPDSRFSNYILYKDDEQRDPESIIFSLEYLDGYDGIRKQLVTLNLHHEEVRDHIYEEFRFWLDPMQDGSGRCAVDGFRIDHMMDDLDLKGKLTGLLQSFWKPLFEELRQLRPSVRFIGEQGDWLSYGEEYFSNAAIDYMFAFNLKSAITAFHKHSIIHHALKMKEATTEGGEQIVFIENHDTNRFATDCGYETGKLFVGAALNILLQGIPCIYYGQELGMAGGGGFGAYGLSDGNDIPRREAMPWYATVEGQGMALWYKDSGPWWNDSKLKDNDGISVEEQLADKHSLLHFYRKLIHLRKSESAFYLGEMSFTENYNDQVLSFVRTKDKKAVWVFVNLCGLGQRVTFADYYGSEQTNGFITLIDYAGSYLDQKAGEVILGAFGVLVFADFSLP